MRAALPRLWGELCIAPHLVCPRPCAGCGCENLRPVCTGCSREARFHLGPRSLPLDHASLRVHALGSYRRSDRQPTAVARALHRFKYDHDRSSGRALAWIAGAYAGRLPLDPQPVVVPVPLSRAKLRRRGLNQAAWIARGLAGSLQLSLAPNILLRVDSGSAQAGLARAERHRQKGIHFVANRETTTGADVLLVDDVVTTGTTLVNCAEALLNAGARSVRAVTLLGVPQYY